MAIELTELINEVDENELIGSKSTLCKILCNVIGDVEIKSFKIIKFKYSLKNEFYVKVSVKNNKNKVNNESDSKLKYLVHLKDSYKQIAPIAIYQLKTSFTKTPYKRFETINQYIQEKNCRKVY